jgi:lysozyme family protein
MNSFRLCHRFVRLHEGGEADSDIDRGGHTFYGVSQFWNKKYPDFFEDPSLEYAERIMKTEFWDPYKLDEVPAHIAVICYDMLVNHSPRDAIKQIQRGAGRLKSDGKFGPNTRSRLREPGISVPRILQWRLWLYDQIIKRHPEQEGNKAGWVWRTNCLNRYSLGLEAGINVEPNGDYKND